MKIESKFLIVKDGEKIFGEGPYRLLKSIEELGSINKAAERFDMSYSKALAIIKKAEKYLGYSLLERVTGGVHGGGSFLTEKGRQLVKNYEDFTGEAREAVEEIFKRKFKWE